MSGEPIGLSATVGKDHAGAVGWSPRLSQFER